MVTISNQAASLTLVNPYRESLANFCPTQTGLRRATRIDFHEHAPGTLSLVREHEEKVRPSSIVNTLREHSTRQAFDVQIFNSDQAVVIYDFTRLFVVKVSTLITNVIVKALKQQNRLSSAVRAFLSTVNATLQSSQLRLRGLEVARIFDRASITQRRKRSNPNVDACHVWIERQRHWFHVNAKHSKPTTSLALNGQRLDRSLNGPMQFDFNLPNLRQPQSCSAQGVADLSKGHAVIATGGSESWIARILPRVHATKEGSESQVNAFQYIFQNIPVYFCNVSAFRFQLRQLERLIEVGNRFSFQSPSITSFLKRSVVQLTTNSELIIKRLLLTFGWINPIAERPNHWANFTKEIFV